MSGNLNAKVGKFLFFMIKIIDLKSVIVPLPPQFKNCAHPLSVAVT